MWIIVTGPDKSGKSTLCKALSYHLLTPIRKCTHDIQFRDLPDIIKDHFEASQGHPYVLWDRWHYPEDIIYGPIVESRPSPLMFVMQDIEDGLMHADGVFVYVTAEPETISERYQESGDDYLSLEQLHEVSKWYSVFMKTTRIPVITINSSWCKPEDMVDIVLKELGRLKV